MAYLLNAETIRNPNSFQETRLTQYAQQKTLSGAVGRDYFGSTKRVWVLDYVNVRPSDYNTIKTIYDSHISTSDTIAWQVTETNYTVAATTVHIDLQERGFSVKGEDYISDFSLILTEA